MSSDDLSALASARYIRLTTFRRDGRAVPTVVWFVCDGERILVWTGVHSGKVKRIRNNPRVTIACCERTGTVTGESWNAIAETLPGYDGQRAMRLLNKKYGIVKHLIDGLAWIGRTVRRTPRREVFFVAITPV